MNHKKLATVVLIVWIASGWFDKLLHANGYHELAAIAGVAGRHQMAWHFGLLVIALLIWHLLPGGGDH